MIAERPEAVAELLDAVDDEGAHRGDVQRAGERLADADRPLEAVVVILGDIKARGGVELYRAVVEDRGGGQPALFDDLGIEVRLERRAGLARGIGAVDRGGGGIEADAADIGEHVAGSIVEDDDRSEEHTSELQSLMRISYAVFCLNKKKKNH